MLILLDFNSTITSSLERRSSNSIFLVRLYYGDESNFTGISTVDFTDGSDSYYGIISSLGPIQDTLELFNFRVKQSGVSIDVINTKNIASNTKQSFSDLVGTNAYDGRKAEIYVIPNENVGNITKEQIFSGVITADFNYDQSKCSIYVNNYKQKYNISLPQTIIRENDTSNDFHYAPEDNFNKPIPMLYGVFAPDFNYDFSQTSDRASDRFGSTRNLAPAIVVNEFDSSSNKTIAKADTQTLFFLDAHRAFLYQSGIYSNIDNSSSQVAVDTSTAKISFDFRDKNAFAVIPMVPSSTQNSSFTRDRHSQTSISTTTTNSNGDNELYDLGIGNPASLGTLASTNPVRAYMYGSVATAPLELQIEIDGSASTDLVNQNATGQRVALLGGSGTTDNVCGFTGAATWQFGSEITLVARTGGANGTVTVDSAWLQVEYTPNEARSYIGTVRETQLYFKKPFEVGTRDVDVEKNFSIPSNSEVIFVGATGREYGSWIDGSRGSPGNNKNSGDAIKHPVHMIEDILRNELGLVDAQINMSDFDTIYNLNTSLEGHFSQVDEIAAFDLIDDICRQFGFYFFFSGDGVARIVPRRTTSAYNPGSYSPSYTISFDDLVFKGVQKTDLSNVFTKIRLEYDYDYGPRKNRLNITTSSTNKADYKRDKDIEFKTSCDKIYYLNESGNDITDAQEIAQAMHDVYLDLYKTRKNVLNVISYNLTHLKCEVGDIVAISDEPSDITLYGTEITNQNFMITQTKKTPSQIELELTQVS